jgi:hypothetical protein
MKCHLEQRPGLEAPESREDKGIGAVSVTPPPVRGDLSLSCRTGQSHDRDGFRQSAWFIDIAP